MTTSMTMTGPPRPGDIATRPSISIDLTHIVAMALERPEADQPR